MPENNPTKRRLVLAGQRFGQLTTIQIVGKDKVGNMLWECLCDCGETSLVRATFLGKTTACNNRRAHRVTHGMFGTLTYKRWDTMIQRCTNPNAKQFPNYGARGINVCERWRQFENFYADMGDPPDSSYMIERKNNDGNYEPDNCIWDTPTNQARNRRSTVLIEIDGRSLTVGAWAEVSGIKAHTIYMRLKKGWNPKSAVFHPLLHP